MSLWGNKDTVYSTGNITTITSGGVVTGSGTTFTDSTLVEAGQVIEMGAYGSGVIKSVDSNTQLTLDSAAGLTAGSGLTQAFNISESPKYLAKDSNWAGNEVYGSDTAEVGAACRYNLRTYPRRLGWYYHLHRYTRKHQNQDRSLRCWIFDYY